MSNVPLPAGTVLGKSFEYGLDINIGTTGAPVWQEVRRMSAWAPTFPKVTQDAATYDDRGAPNEDISGRGFAASFTVHANRSIATGLYLPEIEKIVTASRTKGESAVLEVRFYHKPDAGTPHPTDAGQAFVTVEANRQNTGNAEIDIFSVSLAGKGEYTPIANPWTGWDDTPAPVISSIVGDPDPAGTGEIVTITGTGFLGATGVTFNAIAASDFNVVSATTIDAILPSDSAGDVDVIVTTPEGASAAVSYTRDA